MPIDGNEAAGAKVRSAVNKTGYETMYNYTGGLTKRELLATEIIAALRSKGVTKKVQQGLIQVDVELTPAEYATLALQQTDALLAAL